MKVFAFYIALIAVNQGSARLTSRRMTAAELKPLLFERLRELQGTSSGKSTLTNDAYGHLLELCIDAHGKPNPRLTCTDGCGHAINYVAEEMKKMGLTPLGNTNRTSFIQTVETSVDPDLCPPGISNVIGMVPGAVHPDEYIVYSAHIDGPFNDNPQTTSTRGEGDTSNAYDDGFAVAVGLAMAKKMMENPPDRSVIFFFDDGEEGWFSVGERRAGETKEDICNRYVGSEWYNRVYDLVGNSDDSNQKSMCNGHGYLGASYW